MVGESSITWMLGRERVKVWLMVEVCMECVLGYLGRCCAMWFMLVCVSAECLV